MFSERTATHMAAFFLKKTEGGVMPYIKLIKLMYLAERTVIGEHAYSMCDDTLVAMKNGPVLSQTFDLIKGEAHSSEGIWHEWMQTKDYDIILKQDKFSAPLDYLNQRIEMIMNDVWQKCGSMSWRDIIDHTHDAKNCPEWKNPGDSSKPIHYEDILIAHGSTPKIAKEISQEMRERQQIAAELKRQGAIL